MRLRWLYDPADDRLTLYDAFVIARSVVADRESATYRATNPDEWYWGMAEWLLAEIADRLGIQIWQAGSDGKQPIPDPIERPGVKKPKPRNLLWSPQENVELSQGSAENAHDWLGWEKSPL